MTSIVIHVDILTFFNIEPEEYYRDYKDILNMEDIKFRDYSNILISGQTQAGKSVFLKKLLTHAQEMFVTPPEVDIIS